MTVTVTCSGLPEDSLTVTEYQTATGEARVEVRLCETSAQDVRNGGVVHIFLRPEDVRALRKELKAIEKAAK